MKLDSHAVTRASLLVTLAALTGCAAQLATASSGEIGCPREEITIANQSTGWSTSSWTAECRGKSYYCSGIAGSISCHEQLATPPVATSGVELGTLPPVAPTAAKESCDANCDEGRLCVTSCAASDAPITKTPRRPAKRQAPREAKATGPGTAATPHN